MVNSHESSSAHSSLIAYVPQEDSLFSVLKVRESLLYSALLRLPTTKSYREKAERVRIVLTILGLSNVSESRIGGAEHRGKR